jgi:ATP-dependent Clp protease ATP-binding subunit ClpB
VDFKNTIIILTSNLGSDLILDGIEEGEIKAETRDAIAALLRRSFRPEFLNRLDETVIYKPLSKADIRSIVDLLLADLSARLRDKRLSLALTDTAKEYIIENGYDPAFGARPLKRFLQSKVETLLARKLIADDPSPDTVLTVDAGDAGLYIR